MHNYFCQYIFHTEQQQLLAENEKLASDKADLLKRIQCYEDDLKTANECEKRYSYNSYTYLMLSNCFSVDNEGKGYCRYDVWKIS